MLKNNERSDRAFFSKKFFLLAWVCVQSCLEEMPHHMKTFQIFQNMDEYGEMVVPTDKLEEIKRRWVN